MSEQPKNITSSPLEEAMEYIDELYKATKLNNTTIEPKITSNVQPKVLTYKSDNPVEEYEQDIQEAKDLVKTTDSLNSFTKTERKIIDLAIRGRTPGVIAAQLNLPAGYIRGFLLKKETKDYLRELKEAKSQLIQLKALDIFGEIIDARVDQMEEQGGNFADLTRKDTVDILRAAVELASGIDKSREKIDEGDVYVNILQQVMR